MKRKAMMLLLLAAGGFMAVGVECWPEPDVQLDLLNLGNLFG